LIKVLHNLGVFELAAFLLCTQLVAEGAKAPKEWGFFVALTGLLLSFPAAAYTTFLHGAPLGKRLLSPSFIGPVSGVFAAACFFPWAIFYKSSLLAFLTILAIYAALGFSVLCFGLCWFIGFDSKHAMHRVAVTSAVLLAAFSGFRISGWEPAFVAIFGPAVQILGTCLLLLAILIMSSRINAHRRAWFFWNGLMLVLLGALLFIGNVFVMVGLTNSALTFAVLWLVEKYGEIHSEFGWNPWIAILLVSVLLWRIALFLHTHPGFVMAIFTGI
jgi:hypothetical protein